MVVLVVVVVVKWISMARLFHPTRASTHLITTKSPTSSCNRRVCILRHGVMYSSVVPAVISQVLYFAETYSSGSVNRSRLIRLAALIETVDKHDQFFLMIGVTALPCRGYPVWLPVLKKLPAGNPCPFPVQRSLAHLV